MQEDDRGIALGASLDIANIEDLGIDLLQRSKGHVCSRFDCGRCWFLFGNCRIRETELGGSKGDRGSGYETVDLTDNEMAKLHVRHMVGGHAPDVQHERLCRFEFPERPGALMNFLERMGSGWNISLFHYRNHGADVGRVLVGLQVPERERAAFRRFLRDLAYDYTDESRNPAYRIFLK